MPIIQGSPDSEQHLRLAVVATSHDQRASELPRATTEQLLAGIIPYAILHDVDVQGNRLRLQAKPSATLMNVDIWDDLPGHCLFPHSGDVLKLQNLALMPQVPEGIVIYKNVLSQQYLLEE